MARLARFGRMCDADELPDRDAEPDDRDHQSSQADPVPHSHRHRLLGPDHREGKGNGCFVPLRHHVLCRTCSSCQGGALAVGHPNLPSARRTAQVTRWSPVRLGSHSDSMRHTLQRGSTATSPRSRQPARPPAHRASWDDDQTPSSAPNAASGYVCPVGDPVKRFVTACSRPARRCRTGARPRLQHVCRRWPAWKPPLTPGLRRRWGWRSSRCRSGGVNSLRSGWPGLRTLRRSGGRRRSWCWMRRSGLS